MARAELDLSELDKWSDDLRMAGPITRQQARGVISKGALAIKTEARANAPGGPHTPFYPASINYDINVVPEGYEAEIGPAEGRKQWGLGNLLEYGSAHNPPHPHLEPALDHEEPKFLDACEHLAAGDLWIGGGWATAGGGASFSDAGGLIVPGVTL